MNRSVLLTALLLLASGCYGQNKYRQDHANARCGLYEECGYLTYIGVDSYDECVAAMIEGEYQCEGYNASAAAECVDGLEALTCENFEVGYYPEACLDVCDATVLTEE